MRRLPQPSWIRTLGRSSGSSSRASLLPDRDVFDLSPTPAERQNFDCVPATLIYELLVNDEGTLSSTLSRCRAEISSMFETYIAYACES